jgi:hypothetical protein
MAAASFGGLRMCVQGSVQNNDMRISEQRQGQMPLSPTIEQQYSAQQHLAQRETLRILISR